jgi:hypothetical protein
LFSSFAVSPSRYDTRIEGRCVQYTYHWQPLHHSAPSAHASTHLSSLMSSWTLSSSDGVTSLLIVNIWYKWRNQHCNERRYDDENGNNKNANTNPHGCLKWYTSTALKSQSSHVNIGQQ